MECRMKRLLVAAFLVMSIAGTWATAEEARPISPAQLQKILKFVDTIGGKEEFPPPTAHDLGISTDPNQKLPVTVVVTDDQQGLFLSQRAQSGGLHHLGAHRGQGIVLYVFDTRGPEIGPHPVFEEPSVPSGAGCSLGADPDHL